jgi:hypothetical protein
MAQLGGLRLERPNGSEEFRIWIAGIQISQFDDGYVLDIGASCDEVLRRSPNLEKIQEDLFPGARAKVKGRGKFLLNVETLVTFLDQDFVLSDEFGEIPCLDYPCLDYYRFHRLYGNEITIQASDNDDFLVKWLATTNGPTVSDNGKPTTKFILESRFLRRSLVRKRGNAFSP